MYIDQEKYDLAISEFTSLIEKDSEYANAYNNRALSYYNKGEYEKALVVIPNVLNLNQMSLIIIMKEQDLPTFL